MCYRDRSVRQIDIFEDEVDPIPLQISNLHRRLHEGVVRLPVSAVSLLSARELSRRALSHAFPSLLSIPGSSTPTLRPHSRSRWPPFLCGICWILCPWNCLISPSHGPLTPTTFLHLTLTIIATLPTCPNCLLKPDLCLCPS
jgi:hypothetical protein